MNKLDLVLNNLQWLICHKIKPIKSTFSIKSRIRKMRSSWQAKFKLNCLHGFGILLQLNFSQNAIVIYFRQEVVYGLLPRG